MTNGNNEELVLDLEKEEYRQVRGEMVERDTFIRTTYLYSVGAVGALSWGVISLYLDHKESTERLMWVIGYLPALTCVTFLFVIVAQRRDLVRGGAYIRVFFEDRLRRKGWQERKGRFMTRVKGESNDPIIFFYYAVLTYCIFVNRALGVPFSRREGALAFGVVVFLVVGHWRFWSAAEAFRKKCVQEWTSVLREESP